MIDLSVLGSPAQCRDAASAVRRLSRLLEDTGDDLRRGVDASRDGWQGSAAESFRSKIGGLSSDVERFLARAADAARGLDEFAADLDVVRERMASARATAVAGGLSVSGDTVLPPTPTVSAGPLSPEAQQTQETAAQSYADAEIAAADARKLEHEAHQLLGQRLAQVSAGFPFDELLELAGLIPDHELGTPGVALWGTGLAATAFGTTASWMAQGRHGQYSPRANGKYVAKSAPWHQTVRRAWSSKNWQAKPYQSATRAKWVTAGKVTSRLGVAVSAGTSALDQWTQDSGRSDLSSSERISRTGMRAVAVGGGALAGAAAGAQAGMAIGTLGGPVGVAVGTAVGGLVGGAIGSGAGDWIADHSVDRVGEFAEGATDAIGDVAGSAGDAVRFWD